jgi:hypothetical protein
MANRMQTQPATLEVGQRVCDGEKVDDMPINHRNFMRIAKMANLYQYCTSSGVIVGFPKALISAKSRSGTVNRNDIFSPLNFANKNVIINH